MANLKTVGRSTMLLFGCLIHPLLLQPASALSQVSFEVSLDPQASTEPVTGRLLIFLSQQNHKPIDGPNWFHPEPFFAVDVIDFQPGSKQLVDAPTAAFPGPLADLPAGEYFAQALLDRDSDFAQPINGPGNLFGDAVRVRVAGRQPQLIRLSLDRVIPPMQLKETQWLRFVELRSPSLSAFHRREIVERAAVLLPAEYWQHPQQRFPVKYEITGFGPTLRDIQNEHSQAPQPVDQQSEQPFIHVILTGQCEWGHHVYANSDTNGPRGDALVNEMIPLIDQMFRTIAKPQSRYVTGHSSGGWSSLWLQVNYPDAFGGVWSTAPDPVDFRDFQQINLYRPNANMFVDAGGSARPLARRGTQPIVWYRDFSRMEDVLGPGGQLRSFEAVFSSLDDNGLPKQAWNRQTGAVDSQVIESWQRYDISRLIAASSADLRQKLAGKIHIYMGQLDTFYLEGAVPLLQERLNAAGIDATIEMFPGKDHFNLMTPQLRRRIVTEMTEAFRE